MKKITLLFISFFLVFQGFSQKYNREDSSFNIFAISATYGYFLPGADLKNRFGNNSTIGPAITFKTKSNWVLGLDWNLIFGNKIREDSIFKNIATSSGEIIDGNGYPAIVSLFERGFLTSFKFGKLISINSSNPNSGILLLASVGLMQHKIKIENADNAAYQIKGDYKKGYDRLTNGLSISEYVGYMFYGKNNLINFYSGIEFTQAWTQNRRSYNFDTQSKDPTKRLDMIMGAKIGWMIPFYNRKPSKYYYH